MDSSQDRERKERCARRSLPRLTGTELNVLAALEDLVSDLGYAPSYRQMLERLGWSPKSKGSLHEYLGRLRRLGVIEGSGRSLRVVTANRQNDRSDDASTGGENAG